MPACRNISHLRFLLVLLLACSVEVQAQQGLVITEILSVNRTGLQDEDGEHNDWIELYNDSDSAINLAGYKLTDELEDLSKWEFPDVTLESRRYLVIFASDKDRRVAGSQLHTNFKLERQGELLALITPDGSTVVAAFAPGYPRQVSDVSWGLATDSVFRRVTGPESAVKVQVPTGPEPGLEWVGRDFDDSAWGGQTFGVGFERAPNSSRSFTPFISTDVEEEMYRINGSVYIRSSFNVEDRSAVDAMLLGIRYDDGFVLFLNGERILSANAPAAAALAWDSRATRSNGDTTRLNTRSSTSPSTWSFCVTAPMLSRSRVSTPRSPATTF